MRHVFTLRSAAGLAASVYVELNPEGLLSGQRWSSQRASQESVAKGEPQKSSVALLSKFSSPKKGRDRKQVGKLSAHIPG